jgi:hypothetical protein
MTIIKGCWQTLRGMSLLVVLSVLFTGVLLISCLVRLIFANGFAEVAGKLRLTA